jgi:uncharacterized protein (DUF1684 family)
MDDGYVRELRAFRERKDRFYRDSPESPIPPAARSSFTGLRYYDPNPDLDLYVEARRFEEPEHVQLQTSTGDLADFFRWATIEFRVDGVDARLTVFRDPAGGLFLPFQDANAGGETYGAGRYLEPDELPRGVLHVDFNHAYNPYCAYSDEWSCPLPPAENRLRVAIRAGEMTWQH